MWLVTKLEELLGNWVKGRGGKQQLAKAIGMSPSGLGRGLAKGTLNVENLLSLADVTGIHPTQLLRSADKGHFVDLIEKFYGQATSDAVPARQRQAIDDLVSLGAPVQETVMELMHQLRATLDASVEATKNSPQPKQGAGRVRRKNA